jgi:two-component system, NtrC family, sensor histidine kinase PilS
VNLAEILDRALQASSSNQILRHQLLWMLLLRVVLYILLMAVSLIFRSPRLDIILVPIDLFVLLMLLVFLSTIFSAFFLLVYSGNPRSFGFIQTLLDTGFVSLLVFFSGSSQSIYISVYFFPIIAGGLILPRKGGLVAAAAATLQYGLILLLEANGYYPAYLRDSLLLSTVSLTRLFNHFSVQGLTFFLAAILSAQFGLRLRKTESALSDSLKSYDHLASLYKQIFDNISIGILTIDDKQRITSANNAVAKITGLDVETLVGEKLNTYFPTLNLVDDNPRLTSDFIKVGGEKVRIGYSVIDMGTAPKNRNSPKPTQKIITLKDISTIEKLERQVRQAEKLAAIGMMSASIAHDFRNPLTAISGSAQVLAQEFSADDSKSYNNYQLTTIIIREANRLINTIGDFLRFSRPQIANCSWFSLHGCVNEVLQVCRADPDWPESSEIHCDFDKNLDLWADEKEMFTVFTHLITNGLAFCPTGRERIVITAEETQSEDQGEAMRISVHDNGPGIAEDKWEQVFEPFYTTRAEGTGLGLAIVRQTITEHQGNITIGRSPEGGAVFTITLPLPQ